MAGHIICYSPKHLVLKFVSKGNNSLHTDPYPKRNPNPGHLRHMFSFAEVLFPAPLAVVVDFF